MRTEHIRQSNSLLPRNSFPSPIRDKRGGSSDGRDRTRQEDRYAKQYRSSPAEFDGRSSLDVESSNMHSSGSNLSTSDYDGLNDWDNDSKDWNSYVNELLDNQELSVAWRDILQDKQEAVSRALQDLARTKDNAFLIISEKADVAQRLEDDFKKYVTQARTELRSQLDNSRAMAKRRRKKELAVKRELTEAKKFAQIQAKTLYHDRDSDLSGLGTRERSESYEQETKNAIHKAQLRLFMQQRRLKSARLEMIECLREQQKIQAEMNHLRSLVHRDKPYEQTDVRSSGEREQQRPQSRALTPAYSKPSTPGHLPSPYSSSRSGASERDGMSRIRKNEATRGTKATGRAEKADVQDRSSESLSIDDSDSLNDSLAHRQQQQQQQQQPTTSKVVVIRSEESQDPGQGSSTPQQQDVNLESTSSKSGKDGGSGGNANQEDKESKVKGEHEQRKQEGEEMVQRTRSDSSVVSIEYLSTESCAYHPDLGYVGDGPPTTDAEAAEFARKARDPAAYSEASMKHRRASQHNIEQAIKLMESDTGNDNDKPAGLPSSSQEEKPSAPVGEQGSGGGHRSAGEADVKTSSDPPAPVVQPQVAQDAGKKEEEPSLPAVPEHEEQAHGSVNWSYWGEKRTLAQLICRDIRLSGFLSPACINDEMSKERRKMLLSRTDRSPRILNVAIGDFLAPTMPTGEVQLDFFTGEEVEYDEKERYNGLGMTSKRCRKLGVDVRAGVSQRVDSTTGMRTDERIDAGKGNEDNGDGSDGSK